jgi:CheY-like chemotaxis protein
LEARVPEVTILADDLIWATRLGSLVRSAGARATIVGSAERLADALAGGAAEAVIVDLAARRADPIAAIEAAARAGRPVVAVGAHADLAARKRALAAGAFRVYAYSKLFEDGPRTIAAWLGLPIPAIEPATENASRSGQARR